MTITVLITEGPIDRRPDRPMVGLQFSDRPGPVDFQSVRIPSSPNLTVTQILTVGLSALRSIDTIYTQVFGLCMCILGYVSCIGLTDHRST